MKTFFSLSLLFLAFVVNGQKQSFNDNYTLSQCEGKIPTGYSTQVTDAIFQYPNKKVDETFYQRSFYNLDNLMRSGRILFGDEMSVYLNKVAQNILEKSGKNKLKKEIEIRVLKTSKINYYTMIDGSIFLSIGLLTQLENEAQLAFILAHEIAHYEKRHDEETYTENKELLQHYIRNGGTIKEYRTDLRSNTIDQEVRSDKLGLAMFKKAGYSVDQAKSTLQVLKYSHLPFDDSKFDKTFFNRKNYSIPVSFFYLDTEKEKEEEDEDEDEYESVIEARIEALEVEKSNAGKKFSVSEKDFHYITTKAKFENQFLNLVETKFVRAVYESYVLKQKYPTNTYLDECIAKGLYGMSKAKNYFKKSSLSAKKLLKKRPVEKVFKDESLPLWNLLSNMTMEELNILATKMMIELEDEKFLPYIEDLMKDLVMDMEFDHTEFYTTEVAELDTLTSSTGKDSIVSKKKEFKLLDSAEYNLLSKVEKIVYTQKKAVYDKQIAMLDENKENPSTGEIDEEYYFSAFITELQDTSFANKYERYSNDNTYRYYSDYYNDLSYGQQKKLNKERKKHNRKSQAYGLDSLIIYEPYYYYGNRNSTNMNVPSTLQMKQKWISSIRNYSSLNRIKTLDLIQSFDSSPTLEKLNLSFTISTWYREINTSFELRMLPMSQDLIHDLLESTGYNQILFSGVTSSKGSTYKYLKVLDKDGYIQMNKYTTRGKSNKDDKFVRKIVSQIAAKKQTK